MQRPYPSRALRGLLALAALVVTLLPSVSRAAAPIVSAFDVKTSPITPYNSAEVKFVGNIANIAADTKIIVSATDNVVAYKPLADKDQFYIWYNDDPGNGRSAGDFQGHINITDLGTHDGTPSAIDISVYATNSANEVSNTIVQTVFKNSADPRDVYAPGQPILRGSGPPGQWCHLSISTNGSCTSLSPNARQSLLPICKTPPITTPGVTPPSPLPTVGPMTILPSQPIPQFNGLPCYVPLHSGYVQVAGYVQDATSASFGIASEIQDVVLKVADSTGAVVRQYRSFVRLNTTAYFNHGIPITDFTPGTYTWRVEAVDALGHPAPAKTGTFQVMPDGCPNPPVC